jgi:hypothetical protein
MLFQLVQIEINAAGSVVATTPTQPLFELAQDAQAMAEFSAGRCGVEYGYDADNDCWWAKGVDDRTLIFLVRAVVVTGLNAAA